MSMAAFSDLIATLLSSYFEVVGTGVTLYFTYRGVQSMIRKG